MFETAVGVFLALVAYRGLAVLGTEVLRAWVRRDREIHLARQLALYGGGSWSGADHLGWRLMKRLGIEEVRGH